MRITEAARSLSRDELARLLLLRPDLAAAESLADLASRANQFGSIQRALDELAMPGWIALQLALLAPKAGGPEHLAGLGGPDAPLDLVRAGVDELRALLLCHVEDGRVHLHGGLRTVVPRPLGLGAPAAHLLRDAHFADLTAIARTLQLPAARSKIALSDQVGRVFEQPHLVEELLARTPQAFRAVLADVDAAGGVALADGIDPEALGWLQGHAMLVSSAWSDLVAIPLEVALALRGGRLVRQPPQPPPYRRPEAVVDEDAAEIAGAAAVFALVARVGRLLELLRTEPAPLRKDGALGVKEVRRIAGELHESEADVAWLVELAAVGGFLWRSGRWEAQRLTTAEDVDAWLGLEPVERWLACIDAWALGGRPTHRAGRRRDGRILLTPLDDFARDSPDAEPWRLGIVFAVDAQPGIAVEPELLAATLAWNRPLRWHTVDGEEVGWLVHELTALGVLACGRVTPAFTLLLRGEREAARTAVELAASRGAQRFTVQADGTIVLAGAPDPRIAARLARLTDIESTGHATVYRLSEASLRRALDGGLGENEIQSFLADHATHGVPQPVTVLVADAARRGNALVVGAARSFVHAADAARVEELLHTRKLAKLGLRRAGDLTLVADVEPKALAAALRAAGFVPAEKQAPTPPTPKRVRSRAGRAVEYFESRHRLPPPRDPRAAADLLLAAPRR